MRDQVSKIHASCSHWIILDVTAEVNWGLSHDRQVKRTLAQGMRTAVQDEVRMDCAECDTCWVLADEMNLKFHENLSDFQTLHVLCMVAD